MESGNSSSMQSSSGGGAGGGPGDDQEYESNVGNNNYFFNTTTTNTTPPPPQLQYHSNMQHFIFPTNTPQHQPPQNNYLDSFNDQSNYQNMFWQPQSQQLLPQQPPQLGNLSNQLTQQQYIHTTTATTTTTTDNNYQLLPASTSTGTGTGTKPSTSTSAGMGKGTGVASGSGQKNPRKRTRASRRAPTTVLTTDTTNFRAMVQEFTGIPSSPFSAVASPFLSRRLTDLFTGSPGGLGPIRQPGLSSIGSGGGGSGTGSHLERLLAGSNYPFRPSAHKPQITNLPFQSLLQPGVISSSARYNSLSGSPFHELSGILGGSNNNNNNNISHNNNNQPNMLLSSTSEANANMIGIGHDHGHGGWRVANDDDIGNIITNSNNNNNESNQQQMEGTISGSGTTNYDANNNNNDDNTPASTSAQGTLGNFLG